MSRLFRIPLCHHEFRYEDLKKTGIADLEKPKNNDYLEWQKYYAEFYTHESVTKRIQWTCHKCSEVLYGHYGIGIASKHGKIVP